MASILKVLDIHLSLLKSNPPQLHILAHGLVGSTGWTNPRLQPRFYIDFPRDGIQDFDFVADPPQGISIFPICPITASEYWENPPLDKLKGVRVHSANNFVEEYIRVAKSVAC
ncbi:hypothetical protein A3218_25990 [Pseudomonas chlororaphis]|uniref:hypothetical protein n=1 Tax=Pseudomonas chlororaphis TaxID=587753 RepID=UPI000789C6FB|nr:hypothetical protein [Pseudomonas chlororaphis]AMS17582.1 hypothetical protein A3218_25990 [Pseudomonas chlororaphis]